MRVLHTVGLLGTTLALTLGGCGSDDERSSSDGAAAGGQARSTVSVRFGNLPYMDYAPWVVAEKQGFLKDEGVELKTRMFEVEQPAFEAMAGGAIDVTASGDTPFVLASQRAKDIRLVSLQTVFVGYAIMGREGKVKTYDQLLQQNGGDEEAARRDAALQLKGKSIILPGGASFTPVLDAALDAAGLKRSDVKVIDVDPVEGAAAFIRGDADFFSGGLPQRFRLEKEGAVPVLTGTQLGGGAQDYAGLVATQQILDKHPDLPVRMLRAWYRTIDYIRGNEEESLQTMVDWVNEQAGSDLTVADGRKFLGKLVLLPNYAESKERFWTESSPGYYKKRLTFVLDYFGEKEGLEKSAFKIDERVPAPKYFPDADPSR